jgi:hypothetical protein
MEDANIAVDVLVRSYMGTGFAEPASLVQVINGPRTSATGCTDTAVGAVS